MTRRGSVTIWVLLMLSMVLLGASALAINQAWLWSIRTQLQVVADASALAATDALVGDDLLRAVPAPLPALLQNSVGVANTYAGLNPVLGQPFVLLPNPSNDLGGDVVFGTVTTPRSRNLMLAQYIQDPTNTALAQVNLVQVTARLTADRGNAPNLFFGPYVGLTSTDVLAQAAATLDRDVIGFRPLFPEQSLPLAPLALFSDTTHSDPNLADARSWQYQVLSSNAKDNFQFQPGAPPTFVAGSDGLPEFQAQLAIDSNQTSSTNVALLYLGVIDAAGAAGQLLTGITPVQVQAIGGQLLLGASDNRVTVPGSTLGPGTGAPALTTLVNNLMQLSQSGQVLVWPLYGATDTLSGNPILCGFVAARVVMVQPVGTGPLTFTLQPTMLVTATAVTDATRRGVGGIAIVNPYICKVRLVE
jgi:hypothetical protein